MQIVISAVASLLVQMLVKIISNPEFITKTFILCAEKVVSHTATKLDDDILEAAKKALEAK